MEKPDFETSKLNLKGLDYTCYTDGSCNNMTQPNVGAYAYVILLDGEVVASGSHAEICTTNNRMEMLAVINAVKSIPDNVRVTIYTDSQYCINVFRDVWAHKKNSDLYDLYKENVKHLAAVKFHWVKGHNGNKYNEMADSLAYSAYCEKCAEIGMRPSGRH